VLDLDWTVVERCLAEGGLATTGRGSERYCYRRAYVLRGAGGL